MNTFLQRPTPEPLPPQLVEDLYQINPWWTNDPAPTVPSTRRHLVNRVRRLLDARIAPITSVRGPRQVGKSTAGLQIIADLLAEGVPPRHIMRVQFDEISATEALMDPILHIARWLEHNIVGERFNALAQQRHPAYLFFDEVQAIERWSGQLKFLVDTTGLKVMVTGSSALRIEQGRDSLAGRISTVEAGTLSLTEIGEFRSIARPEPFLNDNGLADLLQVSFWRDLAQHGRDNSTFRDEAFRFFSQRGGYPLAHAPGQTDVGWPTLAQWLNENVIERVLQHDLPALPGSQERDAELLRALLRFACWYVGQTPSNAILAEAAGLSLNTDVNPQQVGDYMRVLADTMLVQLIPPVEMRLRLLLDGAKICLAGHSLRVSWLQEPIPLDPNALAASPEITTMAGCTAESTFGATVSAIRGLDIAHQPEQDQTHEVDFVITIGDRRIPVEVKYQRPIDPVRDTVGLRSFIEQTANRAPFGLLITQTDTPPHDDPRIVSMPLSTFMLMA